MNSNYFYCYDSKLAQYLRHEKKINYITIAKNPNTDRLFTLFQRTQVLSDAIANFKK